MGSPIAHMLTPIFKCPVDCCKNFFYHRGNFNFNLELLKVKLAKTSTLVLAFTIIFIKR